MEVDVRLFAPIATLFASSIASYLWWLNKQRKNLSICILRAEPLIAMKGNARKMLRVSFGDKTVGNAQLLHLSLQNNGNVPVTLSDYQSPIHIELNHESEILEVDVIETWPADLDCRAVSPDKSSAKLIKNTGRTFIELQPVLLNPKDEIVLQLLVVNFNGQLHVSQHIIGIKHIDRWTEKRTLQKSLSLLGACVIFFAAFFVEPDAPYIFIQPSIPYIMLLSLGVMLYVTGQIWPRSERTRNFAHNGLVQTNKTMNETTVSAEGT